jgi:hypothetical protein
MPETILGLPSISVICIGVAAALLILWAIVRAKKRA